MNEHMKMKRLASFALFFLFLIIVLMVIPVTYAINDDVAMRDIASGAMSGEPDFHLIFVKAALGLVLQAMYIRAPGIDWYGLIWIGFLILCTALVLWKVLGFCLEKRKNMFTAVFLFILLFTLTVLGHLVSFQFTVVSGVLVGTAIFIYCTDESTGVKEYLTAALIILLIWLSFCVRENVLLMAVPFGGLVILYKKGSIKKKAVMALIVCIGLGGILLFERTAYSGEEWEAYKDYNRARSVIYDYYGVPPYEENKDFYSSIGLAEYDVVNLERYNLVFVDDLENGKMQQIAEYAKQQYREQNSLMNRIKAGIKTAIKGELERENIILNLLVKLFLLSNLIWGFRYHKKSFWTYVGFLICEGALVFYLGYEGRLPARVMAALLLIELLAALGITFEEHRVQTNVTETWRFPRWTAVFAVILLLAVSVFRFSEIYETQKQRYRSNEEYELLQSFYRENPENVYYINVTWTAGYSDNFHIWDKSTVLNGFSLGGWGTFSPLHNQGLQHFGILDEDRALVENDNVYLILNYPSSKITSHYEEKYEDVQWTEVDKAPVYGMEVPVFKITGGDKK